MKMQILIVVAALIAAASGQETSQQQGLLSNLPSLPNLGLGNLMGQGQAQGAQQLLQGPRNLLSMAFNTGARTLAPNGMLQSTISNLNQIPLSAMSGASSMMSRISNRIQGGQGFDQNSLNNLQNMGTQMSQQMRQGANNLLQGVMPNQNGAQGLQGTLQNTMQNLQNLLPQNGAQGARKLADNTLGQVNNMRQRLTRSLSDVTNGLGSALNNNQMAARS